MHVCVSGLAPASPSKTTCLLPSLIGGVDKEVVGFLSHLKEVKQLRKVVMTDCRNLSPSLIATICEGLCSSNSMEDVVVRSTPVSVFCVTQQVLFASHHAYTFVWLHLTGDNPSSSHSGEPP